MKRVLLVSFLFLLANLTAQTYSPNSNSSYTTCGGTFYDSGGSTGAYDSNENYTVTFCSDNGDNIYLDFSSFISEGNFDEISVYDGATTGSQLVGTYSGTSGGVVGGTNTCITFEFSTDGSVTNDGWEATIGCGVPPAGAGCAFGGEPVPASIPSGCAEAQAFCTGLTYDFENTTGVVDQGSLGCLGSTPNPAWFYLEIDQAGDLSILIEQTGNDGSALDVDYAMLGPYSSAAAACSNPEDGCIASCSYSGSNTETATVTGGQPGEVYLLLLTNYADEPGFINFSQSAGDATTDCTILAPCTADAGLDQLFCSGEGPATIGADPVTLDEGDNYSWTDGSTGTILLSGAPGGQDNGQINVDPLVTTVYTVTVTNSDGCIASDDVTVTVTSSIIPTFDPVADICNGESLTALPTTSINSITGNWSPALDNTATTVYTFTPDAGQCAETTTLTITVNPSITPNFDPVADICDGETITALPTTSINSITGSWSPAPDNTTTTVYTFTPDAGQCASDVTLTITVNPSITPNFDPVNDICNGETITALPTTSINSITGGWSPAPDNTTTTVYTFTPDAGQCAETTTLTITVNPTPTISILGNDPSLCNGSDGTIDVTGSSPGTVSLEWSGAATGNQSTTLPYSITGLTSGTYDVFYTDDVSSCVSAAEQVVLNNPGAPVIDAIPPYTSCAVDYVLPAITGSLTGGQTYYDAPGGPAGGGAIFAEGATISSSTTLYAYDENGVCSAEVILNITINPLPTVTAANSGPFCEDEVMTLDETGAEAISWDWSSDGTADITNSNDQAPVITNAVNGETFTVTATDANMCVNNAQTTVVINPLPTVTIATNNGPVCEGEDATFTLTGTTDADVSYTLNGAPVTITLAGGTAIITASAATVDQVLILESITDGTCAATLTETLTITVNPTPAQTLAGVDPSTCNGTDGTINVTGSSTNSVTVSWSGTASGTNSANLPYTITGLASGTYDVFYTDDVTSCVSATEQLVLNNPGAPIIDIITPFTSCAVDYVVPAITGTDLTGNQAVYDAPGGPAGGGNIIPTGTSISTSTTLYAYDESGVCNSEAIIDITINPLPNSGNNGAAIFCPTDAPSDLTSQLVGTFDAGGSWSPVFNSGTDFFNPDIDAEATYTYTVTNSCGTSSTDVVVTITADPNAGTDGNTTVCDIDPAFDLFGLLGGLPNTGGTWSPALSSGTGVYNPAVDAGGNYTYSIITSCGTFSSIVDVTLNTSDDATFSYATDSFCIDGTNPMASINVTNGGVFTISGGGVINAANGTIDLSGSGVGTFDITYTTNGPCPDVFTLTINVLDASDATITPVGPFCSYDSPILLQAAQSGGIWSGNGVDPVTGEFNPSLANTGLNPITYIIDGLCGDASTIQVEVIPAPIVSTIEDVSIMFGNSVNLIATGNASAYTWTPAETLVCDDCQNTIATPDQTTTYTVWVEENGCSASDQVTITIEYEPIVFVPNIFSPNSDGQNDILYVRGQGILNFTFMVYDRWGEKVFESTALENGWNGTFRGKNMMPAVFVYVVDVNFTNGSSQVISGDVTLVR